MGHALPGGGSAYGGDSRRTHTVGRGSLCASRTSTSHLGRRQVGPRPGFTATAGRPDQSRRHRFAPERDASVASQTFALELAALAAEGIGAVLGGDHDLSHDGVGARPGQLDHAVRRRGAARPLAPRATPKEAGRLVEGGPDVLASGDRVGRVPGRGQVQDEDRAFRLGLGPPAIGDTRKRELVGAPKSESTRAGEPLVTTPCERDQRELSGDGQCDRHGDGQGDRGGDGQSDRPGDGQSDRCGDGIGLYACAGGSRARGGESRCPGGDGGWQRGGSKWTGYGSWCGCTGEARERGRSLGFCR